MRLFTDSEFNSMMGKLISIALVSEDGRHEFYEVVPMSDPLDPWVKDNVMPILGKEPIPLDEMKRRLTKFLKQFPRVTVMADYPIDFKYLAEALETGPGEWMEGPPFTMIVDDRLSAKKSKVPHNALEDARAIRDSWLALNAVDQAESPA